ncbi:MAG: filamentous hemagglutinin family protein [Rhizomicrobium sp.]
MNPIRLPNARAFLLASSSVLALVMGDNAYAGPLSERVGGAAVQVNPTTPAPTISGVVTTPQQVAAQQARTTANLNEAAARLQATLTAQASARAAAQAASSTVPNGLGSGGLQVDPRAADPNAPGYSPLYWSGADQPTQTAANGQTTVTITQHQSQALLNWQTFNVGAKTTVNFVQKDTSGKDQSTWVAINKVNDPNARPSQILGQINAPGSVYVLNRNGVIFGGTAQVNVHSLVAAAANYGTPDIQDDPAAFAAQFSTYGLYSPVTSVSDPSSGVYYDYTPAFTGSGGAVVVQAGAQITTAAPASVTAGGGFVLLLGANVSNAGTIATPDGQVTLAAGDNFYIRPGFSTGSAAGSIADNNTTSTTRGNEVAYTLDANSGSGTVSNTGLLEATTGDITMAGQMVLQDGVAFATTSVAARGTIHLLTSQEDATSSVTLTADSLTTIQPDLSDTTTALDSQRATLITNSTKQDGLRDYSNPYLFQLIADAGTDSGRSYRFGEFDDLSLLADREDQSRVEIVTGGVADFKGGSLTMAQGGQIAVSGVTRTLVESAANLDVSGSLDVLLPVSGNIITVNIQGNELRDAPVNRDAGDLKNGDVYVDTRDLILVPAGTDGYATDRYYTAGGLLEVSGWLANTGHTIGEWTAEGGTITLSSGLPVQSDPSRPLADFRDGTPVPVSAFAGDVVVQPDAIFNLSGGAIDYQGGYVNTTWLLGSDGNFYNLDTAPADIQYAALGNTFQVDHGRWVTTDNYSQGLLTPSQLYEPGYIDGRDAGTLIIDTPTAIFEGQIAAGVVTGSGQVKQRAAGVADGYGVPQNVAALPGRLAIDTTLDSVLNGGFNPAGTDVVVGTGQPGLAGSLDAASLVPGDRLDTVWLDAGALDADGLGGLSINTVGDFAITAPLTLAPGGSLIVNASTADIAADVTARAGSVSINGGVLRAVTLKPQGGVDVTLEAGATIDTRGLFTNAFLDPSDLAGEAFVNGGGVSLTAINGITLAAGSVIDASGGGFVSASGAATAGKGGDISLLADQYDFLSSTTGVVSNFDAPLTIDGTLRSVGSTGGALTLQFPQDLIVSNTTVVNGSTLAAGTAAPAGLTLDQSLTIKAGQPLPLALTQTSVISVVAPGMAMPVSLVPPGGSAPGPTSIVLAAPWTVPPGAGILYTIDSANYNRSWTTGQIIPAGAILWGGYGSIPAGYVLPADVFPHGLAIPPTPVNTTYAAGTVLGSDVTYAPGTDIPLGSLLPADVTVRAPLQLKPDFFAQGFSNYTLTNLGNITITPGTQVNVTEPTYQVTAATIMTPTGSDPLAAFAVGLQPLYLDNPVKSTITQRPGASITLQTASIAARQGLYEDYVPGTPLPVSITSVASIGGTGITLKADWTIPNDPFYVGLNYMHAQDPQGNDYYFRAGDTIPAGYSIPGGDWTANAYFGLEGGTVLPASVFPSFPLPVQYEYNRSTILIGAGGGITVDPKQAITLSSPGQITVSGDLTAHAGKVTVTNTMPLSFINGDNSYTTPDVDGLSIWIAGDIDVSGQAVTAVNHAGQTYGTVTDGGSIVLGNTGTASTSAFVVIRPGAVLDADGASADLVLFPSQDATSFGTGDLLPQPVASNGGAITLTSFSGIYNDGDATARAGGAGAAGGLLSVTMSTPVYSIKTLTGPDNVPLDDQSSRVLTVSQETPAGTLPDDLAAGTADPSLVVGHGRVSVAQIATGGFDSVYLEGNGGLLFDGDVDLNVGRSLSLAGGFSDTTTGAAVNVSAPYVALLPGLFVSAGDYHYAPHGAAIGSASDAGSFTVTAASRDPNTSGGLIELGESERFGGFATVDLVSQGDIRFLAPSASYNYQSTLSASGDLALTAARIYGLPTLVSKPGGSGGAPIIYTAKDSVTATGDLAIHNYGASADTQIPDSYFTTMTLTGSTIEQGGAIFAPLGVIAFSASGAALVSSVDLQPGSLTSTSAAGILLPFGGTTDDLNYTINGVPLADVVLPVGVSIGANFYSGAEQDLDVEKGAVIDVSGGGEFQGKSFISGRGGSVDTLLNPFLTFNPTAGTYSTNSANQVYAIMPGAQPGYAPASGGTIDGSPDPAPGVGQQITIPEGVPGLPAGTYTLLPSNYALLPGAYRVELQGPAKGAASGATALNNGSYLVDGYTGVANTAIKADMPTQIVISSGKAVLDYSQYDQTTYTATLLNQIAQTGTDQVKLPFSVITPRFLADAGSLSFLYGNVGNPQFNFTFDGTALFAPAKGGQDGGTTISISGMVPIEIIADDGTPTQGELSLRTGDLAALNTPNLVINADVGGNNGAGDITVRAGAYLTGDGIALFTGYSGSGVLNEHPNLTIESGAGVNARGNLILSDARGSIFVDAGGTAIAQDTLYFDTSDLNIDSGALIGGKGLSLSAPEINIGTADSLAAAESAGALPEGLSVTQAELNALLAGNASANIPALQSLTLTATGSLNLVGTVDFDTTKLATLEIDTPAIYGLGETGDTAAINAGTLIWSMPFVSNVAATAPDIVAGGPGTGSGRLAVTADEVIFGSATPGTAYYGPATFKTLSTSTFYPSGTVDPGQGQFEESTPTARVASGFANVTFTARDSIVSNSHGSLSVSQADGSAADLDLVTPLLTGTAGSVADYAASGTLTLEAPAGTAPSAATPNALGAEIDLSGHAIDVSSTIVANSGKVVMTAQGDIALGAGARIDLSGQTIPILDTVEYSWGGDLSLLSADGNISQAVGSVIDVSAQNNTAGSVTVQAIGADAGNVSLDGTLRGASIAGAGMAAHAGGFATIDAQTLGTAALDAGFADVNGRLDAGGFTGGRAFDLRRGDLVIAGTVKASDVEIALDGGSLTVNGLVDASGPAPGTIRLTAADDLTLGSNSLLDAHGTVLQKDSYGNPIDAENRAHVELTSDNGTLTLMPHAAIDVSSPEAAPQGDVEINVGRDSETGGDARISAAGPVTIKGAQNIAVNAFWTYVPTDANGSIIQDNLDPGGAPVAVTGDDAGYVGLDQVDARNRQFINAALANPDLMNRIQGLSAYRDAFHLRPGVEIDSATPDGNLTTVGDLDFSGFRYASVNPNSQQTGIYGSGEPGAVIFRAGGSLNIQGNISDGFQPGPEVPIIEEEFLTTVTTAIATEAALEDGVALANSFTFINLPTPNDAVGTRVNSGGGWFYFPGYCGAFCSDATVVSGQVKDNVTGHTFNPGDQIGYFTANGYGGTTFAAGTVIAIAGQSEGTVLFTGSSSRVLSTVSQHAAPGTPVGSTTTTVDTPDGVETITSSTGTQSISVVTALPAAAQMLAPGSLSWSMRFAAGADLQAADTRALQTKAALAAAPASQAGNITLNDPSVALALNWSFYGEQDTAGFSVLRTGTGDLELLAGGDFSEQSPYGVYTAGTQSPDVNQMIVNPLGPDGLNLPGQPEMVNAFDIPRSRSSDGSGTILGDWYDNNAQWQLSYPSIDADQVQLFEAAVEAQRAYYPQSGGDLLLKAQGDIVSPAPVTLGGVFTTPASNNVGNWLWTQGGADTGQPAAWWINFGTYVNNPGSITPEGAGPQLVGFTGIGTLGGGNATILSGNNILYLNAAVASTGRVTAVTHSGNVVTGGAIMETGGGLLTVKADGDVFGTVTDTRGTIAVNAQTVGDLANPGSNAQGALPSELYAYQTPQFDGAGLPMGFTVVQGDAAANIDTRGDLVVTGEANPGYLNSVSTPEAIFYSGPQAGTVAAAPDSYFSLWTPQTAIAMVSAGGNVSPAVIGQLQDANVLLSGGLLSAYMAPGSYSVVAANGDILLRGTSNLGNYNQEVVELAPSPNGELQLLAAGSIQGQGLLNADGTAQTSYGQFPDFSFAMSGAGAGPNDLPNPFRPADPSGLANSYYLNPFAFESDVPTSDVHAGDAVPNRIYAATGDITSLGLNIMAKPTDIVAGGDIDYLTGQLGNDKPNDVSIIAAGGNIIFPDVAIGGPGTLAVSAQGNIFMGTRPQAPQFVADPVFGFTQGASSSSFTSTGLWYGQSGSVSGGANVAVVAGQGANGPDYAAFKALYLDPAKQADPAYPLDFPQNQGKVVQTYQDQLYAWLKSSYGYAGTEADEMAFFNALSQPQQDVFLRQAFFNELNQADVEYNDPSNPLFQSYVRGRTAIATLFPASGSYDGAITMYGGSGIRSEFGGDVSILTPGGFTTIGVEGPTPAPTAGVITQGSGNIGIYSLGSVELGQSRVFTTFGGDITIWSATGDINAGRGAKTAVVYSPPLLSYDDLGNITLSPTVPSQGAGIGTLAPIPQVPPGDVFLVAPLGIIDAGEAGVRVSGNAYLAALQIVNAANIQVQGKAFGLPPKPVTNLALTTASNAATEAAAVVKKLAAQHQSVISVEVTGFGGSAAEPDVCIPTATSPCPPSNP